MQIKNSFSSSDRLKSKKKIQSLFEEGKSYYKFPIKFVYVIEEDSTPSLKFTVTVPKRNIKKAVHRNLIKRRIREAYRTNNESLKLLIQKSNKNLSIIAIYMGKEMINFQPIQIAITHSIKHLVNDLDQ